MMIGEGRGRVLARPLLWAVWDWIAPGPGFRDRWFIWACENSEKTYYRKSSKSKISVQHASLGREAKRAGFSEAIFWARKGWGGLGGWFLSNNVHLSHFHIGGKRVKTGDFGVA